MRRIVTLSALCAMSLTLSNNAQAQCPVQPGQIVADVRTFDNSAMGFTGDFEFSNNQGGQLLGTFGTTRFFETVTYFLQANDNSIRWGWDLSGQANIIGYSVDVLITGPGGSLTVLPLCSGGALPKTAGQVYGAPLPNGFVAGQLYKLRFTFTADGNPQKNLYIDNFRTNGNVSNIILPVRFAGLNASVQSNGNVGLVWNVDVEENVAGYQVERSADGVRYASIGYVSAAGQRSYSYTDAAPIANAYYRIKSVDVDGKFGYSTVVNVKGERASVVMKGFFNSGNTLIVQHDAAQLNARITVTTADGRVVRTVVPQAGSQQTSIALSEAATGMYIIRYEGQNGEVGVIKLVKQ